MQLSMYVFALYTLNIAFPSALFDYNDDDPWEISADILGGVKRIYDSKKVNRGMNYLAFSPIISPIWWWLK